MPEAIVDRLEGIDVDVPHQQAGGVGSQQVIEGGQQTTAVQDPGQVVVHQVVLSSAGDGQVVGHVPPDRHPSQQLPDGVEERPIRPLVPAALTVSGHALVGGAPNRLVGSHQLHLRQRRRHALSQR